MFDSLADRIKKDERQDVTTVQLAMRWASIVIISVAMFGGLYLAVHYLVD
jgi:hypothetical protein